MFEYPKKGFDDLFDVESVVGQVVWGNGESIDEFW